MQRAQEVGYRSALMRKDKEIPVYMKLSSNGLNFLVVNIDGGNELLLQIDIQKVRKFIHRLFQNLMSLRKHTCA